MAGTADSGRLGMGVRWDWAEVQLLAKLGGWEQHKDRHPGKLTLQRGLSRLHDLLVTQAVLAQYETTHHGLPLQIAAFLHNWGRRTSYEWISE